MPKFRVMATSPSGGKEGPFEFTATDAEAACQKYRDWAYGAQAAQGAPLPAQTSGPLPTVKATRIKGT
jgi:hypothetical protein